MILGVGTDIVNLNRIELALKQYGDKFAKRILTPYEYNEYVPLHLKVQFLASRFAAKEACVKALGTGFSNGINFHSIEIKKYQGTPIIFCSQEIIVRSYTLHKRNHFHLSLSHEKEYAIAFVIWETN